MTRRSRNQRREEQRKRQAAVRDAARRKCRPGRDDLARMLLWLMIREAHSQSYKQRSREPLDKLCDVLVTNLELQGFDAEEAENVYNMLEHKYRTQDVPSRIKHHLGHSARDGKMPDA